MLKWIWTKQANKCGNDCTLASWPVPQKDMSLKVICTRT
ncbi:Uncharacterized protein APZ42_032499 [Daphnia magna]|uniref:Uncharacterized protein n=1 Tax=Daphnia magna TaxID=35525 RepID=A0A164LLF7_9CRUS|nr:Uncharacterized protein APZ42_032499 [Daphnia magna]